MKSSIINRRWFSKEWFIAQKSIIALLVLIAVVSALNPYFFTVDNLLNILRQTSVNAIIAVGMTLVILTAGIDLSVGSVLALCGAFAASMVAIELPIFITLPPSCCRFSTRQPERHHYRQGSGTGFYRHLSDHDTTARRDHGLHRRSPYFDRLYRCG